MEEDGRFNCGGVEGAGVGAGGGGGGWWSKWWCWWWCWWMWWSSHEAVGTGPLQSITTSPTTEPPTPTTEELVVSLELCRLGGDGGHRFGRCGLLSRPYVNWYLLSKSLGKDLYCPGVAVTCNYICIIIKIEVVFKTSYIVNWSVLHRYINRFTLIDSVDHIARFH